MDAGGSAKVIQSAHGKVLMHAAVARPVHPARSAIHVKGCRCDSPRVMNEKRDERAKAQPKLGNQCAIMHTSGNLCNTTPPNFHERVDRRADYIHRSRP